MIIVDAQLSPILAAWINELFQINAVSVRSLGLRDASDTDIFFEARKLNAIVMTKDDDFVELLKRLGSPPKIIWITCGNTSNQKMRNILSEYLLDALEILKTTDLVEITD